jgi:hypothetical protein
MGIARVSSDFRMGPSSNLLAGVLPRAFIALPA